MPDPRRLSAWEWSLIALGVLILLGVAYLLIR